MKCSLPFITSGLLCNTTLNIAKGQDLSLSGYSCDANGDFAYILLADGHGHGTFINTLSSNDFSWENVLRYQDEITMLSAINTQVYALIAEKDYDFSNDGTTLSIVKIYEKTKTIKCYWIGDSQIRIYKNKQEVFKSKNHNYQNKKEQLRLSSSDIHFDIKKVPSFQVVDNTVFTMKKFPQIHYFQNNKCEKMMLTRSLGHNELLSPQFQTKTIIYSEHDEINIIVASDGFWDIFPTSKNSNGNQENIYKKTGDQNQRNQTNETNEQNETSSQNNSCVTSKKSASYLLAKTAEDRWRQKWQQLSNKKPHARYTTKLLPKSSYDDISVAIYGNIV